MIFIFMPIVTKAGGLIPTDFNGFAVTSNGVVVVGDDTAVTGFKDNEKVFSFELPLKTDYALSVNQDDNIVVYQGEKIQNITHAYCISIHKSQGSEYKSVIINLQCAHHIMLTRPLVYTAITRGKERVIIVGERRALCIAIKKTDTEKRGTCLAHRLQELA